MIHTPLRVSGRGSRATHRHSLKQPSSPQSLLRASGTQDQILYMNRPPEGRTARLTGARLDWKVTRLPNKCADIRAYLYARPWWRELQLAASAPLPTLGPAHCLDAGLGTSAKTARKSACATTDYGSRADSQFHVAHPRLTGDLAWAVGPVRMKCMPHLSMREDFGEKGNDDCPSTPGSKTLWLYLPMIESCRGASASRVMGELPRSPEERLPARPEKPRCGLRHRSAAPSR